MPLRTCVGCRRAFDKRVLVRLVAAGGSLVVDHSHGAPGRGAYICPERSCVDKALGRPKTFSRALRTTVTTPGPDALWQEILEARQRGG